nr:3'-5' exonuclease [Veillonella denticariosi]
MTRRGHVLETFERFINPGRPVGQSEEVHGFSDVYLAENGEDPVTVLGAFKEFSRNAVIVGHNVNYDISIFTNELARHNLGQPEFKAVYDTLDIFRRFYPNLPNHKLGGFWHLIFLFIMSRHIMRWMIFWRRLSF